MAFNSFNRMQPEIMSIHRISTGVPRHLSDYKNNIKTVIRHLTDDENNVKTAIRQMTDDRNNVTMVIRRMTD